MTHKTNGDEVTVDATTPEPSEMRETPVAAATVDADGLTCGSLEPLIATHLRRLAPGEVLEVLSDRTEAADGISAWVSLAGHTLVAIAHDQRSDRRRYFVKKKALENTKS
jgi:TusA-related sulfurtransferase